jgi:fibronectin type 3 domain-containing protein
MTSLDISKNINLVQLNCSGNKLTELDIHNNTKIKYLDFIETKIKKFTANLFGTISTISSNANGYLSIETDSFPTCNIIACPFSGMSFTNWTLNNKIVSTNASYSITAAIPNTLTANFSGSCSVTAIANNTSYGTVTGAGNYNYDDMATVKAFPKAGYRFVRWIDAELSVPTYSRNCIYTFPVCGDKHLKAEFAKIATPSISSSKSSGYNSVTLKWGSVTGANSYNIYRATSKSGTYSKIASTTSTSYKNTSLTTGKTYYYKVKAVCVAGSTTTYSSYSAYKYAKPIPSTPSTTVKSNSYTSIKVSWGKIDGASGYKVYRATSKTGTYSLIKTTTSTSYTNSSLKTGKTYYYKVRAYRTVGSSKVYSSYSAYHSAKPVPSTPTETVSSASYNSIKVYISDNR